MKNILNKIKSTFAENDNINFLRQSTPDINHDHIISAEDDILNIIETEKRNV